MDEMMLTAAQAAVELGIRPVSVRWRCEKGMFPGAVNAAGRTWLIPRREVEQARQQGRLPPGRKPRRRTGEGER